MNLAKKLRDYEVPLNSDIIQTLEQGLLAEQYEVVVLREQNMGFAEPLDFDYRIVNTDTDPIIHVIIKDAGVSSPHRSLSYKPQLNVDVNIVSKKTTAKSTIGAGLRCHCSPT
jgi:hypothetical protein